MFKTIYREARKLTIYQNCGLLLKYIPLVKDMCCDLTRLNSFRGITLSPTMSKIFDMCLISLFEDHLLIHDLHKKNLNSNSTMQRYCKMHDKQNRVKDFIRPTDKLINVTDSPLGSHLGRHSQFLFYWWYSRRHLYALRLAAYFGLLHRFLSVSIL